MTRVVAQRTCDLVKRRRHCDPEQEGDGSAYDEQVEEDRDRLGDAVAAEPLDARPDRRRKGKCQEQEDEDAPHLPHPGCERNTASAAVVAFATRTVRSRSELISHDSDCRPSWRHALRNDAS